MSKDIQVCVGVDVDAVAGWLGSYGGEDSPNDIQRGVFAGQVGTPRLLSRSRSTGIGCLHRLAHLAEYPLQPSQVGLTRPLGCPPAGQYLQCLAHVEQLGDVGL